MDLMKALDHSLEKRDKKRIMQSKAGYVVVVFVVVVVVVLSLVWVVGFVGTVRFVRTVHLENEPVGNKEVGDHPNLPLMEECLFQEKHPPKYPLYHLRDEQAILVDGQLDDEAWKEVPWTEDFVDIQGLSHAVQPWFKTRVKMRWNDQFLYVGAFLEEEQVWATLDERNSIVFQDNDFEIFVDPSKTTHNYKELEINAFNTTWNLLLNKPYANGGHENSTRVDQKHGFDMFGKGLQSAVYIKGRVNQPQQNLKYWSVEVALPLHQLAFNTNVQVPPLHETYWRINFSRVEWLAEVVEGKYRKIKELAEENWVWSPQYAINMHMPERWGYVQFLRQAPPSLRVKRSLRYDDTTASTTKKTMAFSSSSSFVPNDPEWPIRYLTFQVYYAQEKYFDQHQRYAQTPEDLHAFYEDRSALACLKGKLLLHEKNGTYTATVRDARYLSEIQSDRCIRVIERESALVS